MLNKNYLGHWTGGAIRPEPYEEIISGVILDVSQPIYLVKKNQGIHVALDGSVELASAAAMASAADAEGRYPLIAVVPPLPPGSLGDPYFKSALGLRYAYVVGAMANGITSVDMVDAAARTGMIGFFGAAFLGGAAASSSTCCTTAAARPSITASAMPWV